MEQKLTDCLTELQLKANEAERLVDEYNASTNDVRINSLKGMIYGINANIDKNIKPQFNRIKAGKSQNQLKKEKGGKKKRGVQ